MPRRRRRLSARADRGRPERWSWPSFLSTVAGALVALAGAGLFAFLDRRDRYRTRLAEALASALRLGAQYVDEARAREVPQLYGLRKGPAPSKPELEAALYVVLLLARGRDVNVALTMTGVLRHSTDERGFVDPDGVAAIQAAIRSWSLGSSRRKTIRDLIARSFKGDHDTRTTRVRDTITPSLVYARR